MTAFGVSCMQWTSYCDCTFVGLLLIKFELGFVQNTQHEDRFNVSYRNCFANRSKTKPDTQICLSSRWATNAGLNADRLNAKTGVFRVLDNSSISIGECQIQKLAGQVPGSASHCDVEKFGKFAVVQVTPRDAPSSQARKFGWSETDQLMPFKIGRASLGANFVEVLF